MKRVVATLVAVTVGLSACGGDDDTDAAAERSPATAPDGGSDDAPATEPSVAASTSSGDADAGGDGSGAEISSIDDIPPACRELVAEFLGEVEPIVETTDWSSATLADFERIAADFEAIDADFESRATEAGCDDLTFADDADFNLLVELAREEAPGTVPFFEFLEGFAGAFETDDAEAGGEPATAVPGGDFADCDEAMEFIESLTEDYETVQEVPVSELAKIAGLGAVMMSCTPEQLEYFDSPEVNEFLGG